MASIHDVKQYWQSHPLLSFELTEVGSKKFFEELDRIKREDVDKFSLPYWDFDRFKDKKVLDVGCGPGWLVTQYALAGADVFAIDLTPRAVELTKKFLEFKGVSARVEEGNAEKLQFENDFFDLVASSGVLHHTPNILQAFKECFRVLKPGGNAKITLYHKGFLHKPIIFPVTKMVMKFCRVKHPGADLSKQAKDVDDFIRQYDGAQNPVGLGNTTKEWSQLLQKAGFKIENYQLHFFPKRFLPLKKIIPNFVHYFLDKYYGTMIYFDLMKPE